MNRSSKRWVWLMASLTLVAVAAWLARGHFQRPTAEKGAQAPNTQPATGAHAAEVAIELTGGDLARAHWADLGAGLSVTGSVKAVNSAFVKAKVAGELKSLTVREGEQVSAGQLLGVVDGTEYELRVRQAEEQAVALQAQLDIAQRTLANNKALVDQGFISRTALDASTSNVSAALASLQGARAAADLSRKAARDTRITAPISGLVSQRLVQAGERVGVDARILEIVDLSKLELEALVPPEDVVSLRLGQSAQVLVDGLSQPVAARVARINPVAQTGTRSVQAYLSLAPASGLRQGLFARATVELSRQRALVVPVSALRYEQSQPYVLVVVDGVARQRPVDTGLRGTAGRDALGGRADGSGAMGDEPVVEITRGLAEGDLVLRGTVGALRAGARVSVPDGIGLPASTPAAAPAPPAPSPAASR